MRWKELPWFGRYSVGVGDGAGADAIVRGDPDTLAAAFANRSLDEPLYLTPDMPIGSWPLGIAIAASNRASLEWMLDHGARLDSPHGSAFLEAAYFGDAELLRELAARGANIHADHGFGDAFARALYGGKVANLAVIHELGHDAATYGGPALRSAVGNVRPEAVDFFLSHGADVNFRGPDSVYPLNWTPLHVAASNGHADFARQLVEAGADIHLTDAHGNLPYDLAWDQGHVAIADYLRSIDDTEPRTREAVLASPAAHGLPDGLIAFLDSDDRRIERRAGAPRPQPVSVDELDFLRLQDAVPMRIGRTRTVLRISHLTDIMTLGIVWSPRLKAVGAVSFFTFDTPRFYRLGQWDAFHRDPFAQIDRIVSGELGPTSA